MRYTSAGRRKQMTIGSHPDLGLVDARAKANEAKRLDPLAEHKQALAQGSTPCQQDQTTYFPRAGRARDPIWGPTHQIAPSPSCLV